MKMTSLHLIVVFMWLCPVANAGPKLSHLMNNLVPEPENKDGCPQMSGQEELIQLAHFWMAYTDMDVGIPYTMEEIATRVMGNYVQNPAYYSPPSELKYTFKKDLMHEIEGIVLRVVITEREGSRLTSGGSSFRINMKGDRSKAMCPYRDYFNGTYLLCCNVVEDYSVLTILHEYSNFAAYEVYAPTNNQRSKRNATIIWQEPLTVPKHYSTIDASPIITSSDTSYGQSENCERVDYGHTNGHWIKRDEMWKWVVDGCRFLYMRTVDVQECFYSRYFNEFYAFGDYHIRNLFYYIIKELAPTFDQFYPIHNNIDINKFHFKWSTTTYVLEDFLEDFLINLDDGVNNNGTLGGRKTNFEAEFYEQKLLIFDLGIWPILSRPIADYVLAIDNIAIVLRKIVDRGTTVVFQDTPATPNNTYTNKPNPSNQLYAALNYFACTKLKAVGVHCAPNWRYTMPWINDLVCTSKTQTMCFDDDTQSFKVTPPGHVTTQYILSTACSRFSQYQP